MSASYVYVHRLQYKLLLFQFTALGLTSQFLLEGSYYLSRNASQLQKKGLQFSG